MDHDDIRSVASLILYIGINRLVAVCCPLKSCVFSTRITCSHECCILPRDCCKPMRRNNCNYVDNGFGSYGACADYFYDEGYGTLTHCIESCEINYWCQGVAYSAATRICRRFTCSESKIVNEDFIFYSIHCTETRIEKNRAKHCVFKLPLPEHEGKCSTDTSTVISQSECKESCHVDNTCRGFTYDTSRNICQQHDCPSSEKEGRLSTIYVRKLCGYSACQYVEIDGSEGAHKTQINYFKLCISQCESSDGCHGFEIGSASAAASGPVCTTYSSAVTTDMSSSGSRILFTKKCPDIAVLSPCKWTSHGNGTIGDCLFYDVIYGTLESCLAVCDSEVWCFGISYSEELHMCYLYPCKSSVREAETMQFYSHLCPGPITSDASHIESTSKHDDILVESEVMTSLSTTHTVKTTGSKITDSFSNPVSTTSARATFITYNNTVLCYCKCVKSSNETYPQFYNRIIEPLKLDKKQLSSYIRKRNSANDDRKSAAYFGCGGIFVLVTAIVVIVLADFSLLYKNINKLRKKRLCNSNLSKK